MTGQNPVRLLFYSIDARDFIQFIPVTAHNNPQNLWSKVINCIQNQILDRFPDQAERYQKESDPFPEPASPSGQSRHEDAPFLIFLLARMEAFSQKETMARIVLKFRNSPYYNIRSYIGNQEIREKDYQKFVYDPIITIGSEDIMTVFAEETYSLYLKNKHIYDLHIDSRIKFLDSSIWHRYVALYPNPGYHADSEGKGPFEHLLSAVLSRVFECLRNNIYATNAARSFLEFQCRMLLNSFIAEVGDQGHHEIVTPFKFHSETQMARRARVAQEFFLIKRPSGPFSRTLAWHTVFVDDYAEEGHEKRTLTTYSDSIKCLKNKRDIILSLLQEDRVFNIMDDDPEKITFHIEPPEPEDHETIIQATCRKLTERIYDLIFVDYLLGDSRNAQGTGREYGHDFLKALIENQYRDLSYHFKIGPITKFWIFPTSSFPQAFSDKIRQLGLTSMGEHFYMSGGGDPISTPEMFRFNLYHFLKQQIELAEFTDEGLARFVGNLSNIEGYTFWKGALTKGLDFLQTRNKILEGDKSNGSLLAERLVSIFDKRDTQIQAFLNSLKDAVKEAEKFKTSRIWINKFHDLLNKYSGFKISIAAVLRKIMDLNHADIQEKLIRPAKQKDLSGMNFWRLTGDFDRWETVEELDLSNNDLEDLPAGFACLKSLKKLNLDNNPSLSKLPQVLKSLPRLETIRIRGTKFKSLFTALDDVVSLNYLKGYNHYWLPDSPFTIYVSYARPDNLWYKILRDHFTPWELCEDIKIIEKSKSISIEDLDKAGCIVVLSSKNYARFEIKEMELIESLADQHKVIKIAVDEEGKKVMPCINPLSNSGETFADLLDQDSFVRKILTHQIEPLKSNWKDQIIGKPRFGSGYAFLVGTGKGNEDGINNQVINDVNGLRNALLMNGYAENQVTTLKESEATKENILHRFELFKDIPEESIFVFYFSGHGNGGFSDDSYGFFPYGSNEQNEKTVIKTDELERALNSIPSKKKLIILDCCKAAGVGKLEIKGDIKGPDRRVIEKIKAVDYHIICASQHDEYAYLSKHFSLFTECMLEAFGERKASVLGFSDFVSDRLKNEAKRIGKKQEAFYMASNANFDFFAK